MNVEKLAIVAGVVVITCSCATMIEGQSQVINLTSSPLGADCVVTRDAELIGRVATPGNFTIDKSKHNIQIACFKEGYEDAVFQIKSGNTIAGIGNIAIGFGVGFIVDSIAGSDNHYDTSVSIALVQNTRQKPLSKLHNKHVHGGPSNVH